MNADALLPGQTLKNTLIGCLMVVLATCFWALIGPLARFGLAAGLSPMEVAFWRACFGGIFFLLHGFMAGLWKIDPKRRLIFIAFSIPGVVFLFFTYQIGVKEAGAAMTSVLQYTAPIWVAIWARVFFKEGINLIKLISIILAITGAALVSISGGGLAGGASALGIIAGLASGFFFSLHFAFGKKYLSSVHPITLYMHILPAGALFMLPFVEFKIQTQPFMGVWVPMIILGLLTGWAGYWAYCEGLKRLAATRVAVLASIEPFIAAFFAFMWWGENFSPFGWIGAVLIVSGVLVNLKNKNQ